MVLCVVNGLIVVSLEVFVVVCVVIDELNYVFNWVVCLLVLWQMYVIVFIVLEDIMCFFGDLFFVVIVVGIMGVLGGLDYFFNLFIVSDDFGDKMISFVCNGGVDGVLIVLYYISDVFIDWIVDVVLVVYGG